MIQNGKSGNKKYSCLKVIITKKYLSLNINKAKKVLGWEPVLSFDETIEFTTEWYIEYKNKNIYSLCSQQIAKYEDIWKSKN